MILGSGEYLNTITRGLIRRRQESQRKQYEDRGRDDRWRETERKGDLRRYSTTDLDHGARVCEPGSAGGLRSWKDKEINSPREPPARAQACQPIINFPPPEAQE